MHRIVLGLHLIFNGWASYFLRSHPYYIKPYHLPMIHSKLRRGSVAKEKADVAALLYMYTQNPGNSLFSDPEVASFYPRVGPKTMERLLAMYEMQIGILTQAGYRFDELAFPMKQESKRKYPKIHDAIKRKTLIEEHLRSTTDEKLNMDGNDLGLKVYEGELDTGMKVNFYTFEKVCDESSLTVPGKEKIERSGPIDESWVVRDKQRNP